MHSVFEWSDDCGIVKLCGVRIMVDRNGKRIDSND